MQKLLNEIADAKDEFLSEVAKNIIGYESVIEKILVALFCQGHCVIEGVPGLAKTLLIKSIAETLELNFSRIQFTPDLMPSDITGSDIIRQKDGNIDFEFNKGPIFGNIVLADEINRTPPKTQAALLECMQERTVTVNGKKYELENPFIVLATQNPVEQEGTYPLPEAQLDRFLFYLVLNYPSQTDEIEIVKRMSSMVSKKLKKVLKPEKIIEIQKILYEVPVSEDTIEYAVRIGRHTRPENDDSPDFIKKWVKYGVSPRAIHSLVFASKSLALIRGNPAPSKKEIKELVKDVFRHRIILNFQAEADGISIEYILNMLINQE
jgi:MoxR-like ATPase